MNNEISSILFCNLNVQEIFPVEKILAMLYQSYSLILGKDSQNQTAVKINNSDREIIN